MPSQQDTDVLPCIALIRPLTMSCPSMLKAGDDYLYPKLLKALIEQKVFSEIILSVAQDVPESILRVISAWGLDVHVGKESLPHSRACQLAHARGMKNIGCISSYSYFFDKDFISEQAKNVVSGEFDFGGSKNALSNLEFCILGEGAIDFLLSVDDRAIVPSKPQAISRTAPDTLRGVNAENAYTLSEQFLWLMMHAGEIGMMPTTFISGYYDSVSEAAWFQRDSREKYLLDYFDVDDIGWIDALLQDELLTIIPLEKLVGQLRWSQRFEKELPLRGGRMVELGFGQMPVLSFILSLRFKDVIALEPLDSFAFDKKSIRCLLESLPDELGSHLKRDPQDGLDKDNIRIHKDYLENLHLKSESVDFCVSKMVFEHVQDVSKLSHELRRILKPGGIMLHEIGLNDHTGGTSSGVHFNFLRHSQIDWNLCGRDTNLLRVNDYVGLWESMGFKVKVVHKVVSQNVPPVIHKFWFSYNLEDLLCQVAVIKAVKI